MPTKSPFKKERKVIIGGNWWSVAPLTQAKADAFLKRCGLSKKEIAETPLRGYCDYPYREIAIDTSQDDEEVINTVLHEGLHGIINEIGSELDIRFLNKNENEPAIYRLTAEILSYLKQTGVIQNGVTQNK